MAWLVVFFAVLMAVMGVTWASPTIALLSAVLALLVCPPLWAKLKDQGRNTYSGARGACAVILGLIVLAEIGGAYSQTPEGRAAIAREAASRKEEVNAEASQAASGAAKDQEAIVTGEHCLSGWDNSFPPLVNAVKEQLRDPSSFEHVETVRSPVDAKGKFGLIMTFRAANGFGGKNVEAVGVEVDAASCDFRRVSNEALAKRLR